MTQLAYCYNDSGYYTHTEYCTIDPLASAVQGHTIFVVPANACLDAPTILDGYVAQRVNETWVNVENHIGEKGFVNGIPTEIKDYGSLPEGWSTTPPAPSLEEQLAAIESEYAQKLVALDASLLSALWADGANEVANRQTLSAKRQQLIADKDEAIMNILLMAN